MSLIRASEADEQKRVQSLPPEAGLRASGDRHDHRHARSATDLEADELRRALAAAEDKREQLVAAARDQGRRDAIAAHKRDEAAHLAVLTQGIESALAAFLSKVETLNHSAVMVCEGALARLIGNTSKHRDLISASIANQLDQLEKQTIIAVHVSAEDFLDQAALAAIASRFGEARLVVRQDSGLAPGSCRIDLCLGSIEISLPDYWTRLQSAFAELKHETLRP